MGQVAVIERQQPQPPAFSLADLERIATTIARGGMFGSKDPYAVMTLCMLAQAEGQHPAVVFRDYDIIQGTPSKKAKAMLADFLASGGTVKWHRYDDEAAEATFTHPAGGEVTINWNMARAHKAGLGGKDMWKKYPRQMLRSRCISEGVSTVFPGATSGLYVPEEVRDFSPDTAPADTPPTPQAMRARDLKAQKPQPKQIEAKPASRLDAALAEIAACKTQKALREWWQANSEAIGDGDYDQILSVFNDRLASVKSPGPATGSPAEAQPEDDDAAPSSSEGPADEERGETPTLDDAKLAVDRAELVPDINGVVASYAGQLSDEDQAALQEYAMGRISEKKGGK